MQTSPSSIGARRIVTRLRSAGCVFAVEEADLLISAARTPAELEGMVDGRVAGLPLEHVVGWAEFCGLRIAVDPGVFVPRRRTEFLVQQAAAVFRPAGGRRGVAIDLCCGSGAVGAALAATLQSIDVHASDLDPAAVRCARRNLAGAGGRVYEGDLFEALPAWLRGRADLLVANVPYVPSGELGLLPAEARTHEPRVALDGGVDGLDVLRRVAAAAPRWLTPGGHLLSETAAHQAGEAVQVLARHGLITRAASSRALDTAVIIGILPDQRNGRTDTAGSAPERDLPSDHSPVLGSVGEGHPDRQRHLASTREPGAR